MANKLPPQTFYFLHQDRTTNEIGIIRIKGARKLETAVKKAWNMPPVNTISFMVMEETQLNKFADDIKKATRHLIGEEE